MLTIIVSPSASNQAQIDIASNGKIVATIFASNYLKELTVKTTMFDKASHEFVRSLKDYPEIA